MISSDKIYANTADVKCSVWVEGSITEGSAVKVKVDNVEGYLEENDYDYLQIFIIQTLIWVNWAEISEYKITSSGTYTFPTDSSRRGTGSWKPGSYEVEINTPRALFLSRGHAVTSCNFSLTRISVISPEEIEKSNELLCHDNENCLNCLKQNNSWTALGCISTSKPTELSNRILTFAIGIGGAIAFLLMIFGGLQIIFSGGNPDKVKAGKEIITAALAGLLLIIFSVFILRVIGYDILKLPGFNK